MSGGYTQRVNKNTVAPAPNYQQRTQNDINLPKIGHNKKFSMQIGNADVINLDSTAQMLNSYAVANQSFQTFHGSSTDPTHMLNATSVGQFSKLSRHRKT